MNIINRVTLRQMKENKRRTLVTLIGIALSVTMVTAVATVVFSYLDMMQRSKIEQDGNWHVAYSEVDSGQIRQLGADAGTQAMLLSRRIGYARFYASRSERQPYLYVRAYNEAAFENFPVTLLDGRFPTAPGEMVLAQSAVQNSGVGIGEKLHLDIGKRYTTSGEQIFGNIGYNQYNSEQEFISGETTGDYTVVGILETPGFEDEWDAGFTAITFLDESALGAGLTATASLLVRPLDRSLFDRGKQLGEQIGVQPEFHTSLLQYYGLMGNGTTYQVLMNMVLVLVLIILIGSAALIHNAFSISLSQRSRQMGILASVGATKQQMRQSVLFEGALLGAVAIPAGLLAGTAGIGVTFLFLGKYIQGIFEAGSVPIRLIISPASILLSIVLAALVILLSVWAPARKAARIAPMEAIRQSKEQRIRKESLKTGKWTQRVWGIEGVLARKNSKRSPRQSRTIVASLAVSVVLFLATSFGIQSIMHQYQLENEPSDSDMEITLELKESVLKQRDSMYERGDTQGLITLRNAVRQEETRLFDRILEERGITQKVMTNSWLFETKIETTQLSQKYAEYLGDTSIVGLEGYQSGDGRTLLMVQVMAMDSESFRQLCEKTGAQPEAFTHADSPACILINRSRFKNYSDKQDAFWVELPMLNVKDGDSLPIGYFGNPENQTDLGEIRIARVATEPIDMMGLPDPEARQLVFVVPEATLEGLLGRTMDSAPTSRLLSVLADDTQALHTRIGRIDLSASQSTYFRRVLVSDNKSQREATTGAFLTAKVFAGGFIALISAIGVANIFNTVSTGVMLRRREYAMLQSAGMTPKSFRSMMRIESFWYGLKALLYGIPVSFLVMLLLHAILQRALRTSFAIPWSSLVCAVCAVFAVTGLTMAYAYRQVKKGTLIDAVREESI